MGDNLNSSGKADQLEVASGEILKCIQTSPASAKMECQGLGLLCCVQNNNNNNNKWLGQIYESNNSSQDIGNKQ